MRFKVDESLPSEIVEDLRLAGQDAESVPGEGLAGIGDSELVAFSLTEQRVLLTLDKGLASIVPYPPGTYAGIVLFRPGSSGRSRVAKFIQSRLPELLGMDIENRVTVVTEHRISDSVTLAGETGRDWLKGRVARRVDTKDQPLRPRPQLSAGSRPRLRVAGRDRLNETTTTPGAAASPAARAARPWRALCGETLCRPRLHTASASQRRRRRRWRAARAAACG